MSHGSTRQIFFECYPHNPFRILKRVPPGRRRFARITPMTRDLPGLFACEVENHSKDTDMCLRAQRA